MSIHSDAEVKFLKDLSSRWNAHSVHIGLIVIQNFVRWTDGSVLDYEYWRPGQPDYRNGERVCTSMTSPYWFDGKWGTIPCSSEIDFNYICKKPAKGNYFGNIHSKMIITIFHIIYFDIDI